MSQPLRRRHLRALYRLSHTYAIAPPIGTSARVLAELRAAQLSTLIGREHEVLDAGEHVVQELHSGSYRSPGLPAYESGRGAVAGLRRLA